MAKSVLLLQDTHMSDLIDYNLSGASDSMPA